jgi:hypothetical protein
MAEAQGGVISALVYSSDSTRPVGLVAGEKWRTLPTRCFQGTR